MDLYQRPGSRYWIANITVNGKRIRRSTKQTSHSAALKVFRDLDRELSQKPDLKMSTQTLREFAEAHFLPWVADCGRELKTKEDYRYGWLLLKGQKIADMRMDQIRKPHVDTVSVVGSPSTKNCALRTLRRMFNIAIELELLGKAPKVHLAGETKRTALIDPGTEEKIGVVLARSKRRGALQVAMYVILDAGMRPAEIAQMKIGDIDFVKGKIHVPKGKTAAAERYLPMSTRLKELLFSRIGKREEGWVFPSPRYYGKPIQRQALTQAWRRACNRAGVSGDLKLYCSRHTFATDVMEATKNPFKVQKMLGHTRLSTTERYQHHEIAEVGILMDERNLEREKLLSHNRHSGLTVQ